MGFEVADQSSESTRKTFFYQPANGKLDRFSHPRRELRELTSSQQASKANDFSSKDRAVRIGFHRGFVEGNAFYAAKQINCLINDI